MATRRWVCPKSTPMAAPAAGWTGAGRPGGRGRLARPVLPVGLGDQAGGLELADERGHRGAREPGAAGDLGAAGGARPAQHVDDLRPVALAEGAQGAMARVEVRPRPRTISAMAGICQ